VQFLGIDYFTARFHPRNASKSIELAAFELRAIRFWVGAQGSQLEAGFCTVSDANRKS
jgi:hypothetical protein